MIKIDGKNFRGQIIKKFNDLFLIKDQKNNLIWGKVSGTFKYKNKKNPLLLGDFVIFNWDLEKKLVLIDQRLARKNKLKRPAIANVKLAFIFNSFSQPKLDFVFLNKILIWISFQENITPILIFTKKDLYLKKDLNLESILKYYQTLFKCFFISKNSQSEIIELKSFINETSVFLGRSGVGKSTLLNLLVPTLKIRVGEISSFTKMGKHTTTVSQYYEINNNLVADTPGFNWLNLKEIPKNNLVNYYPFFRKYSNQCHYKNCMHLKEPKCFIKEEIKVNKELNFVYQIWIKIFEQFEKEN